MRDAMSGPLSRRATGIDRLLGLVLFASLVALIAGLILPAITIRSMFLATDFSLLESVWKFLEGGDWFLFVITFLFSVAFPIVKILTGLALWFFLDATGAYARPVIGCADMACYQRGCVRYRADRSCRGWTFIVERRHPDRRDCLLVCGFGFNLGDAPPQWFGWKLAGRCRRGRTRDRT